MRESTGFVVIFKFGVKAKFAPDDRNLRLVSVELFVAQKQELVELCNGD